MTPADELWAAAEKLRALATAASTGPRDEPTSRWHFKRRDARSGYLYAANPHGPGMRLIHGDANGGNRHPGMHPRHGEYAAAMGPAVGLAVANWLDGAAALIAELPGAEYLPRTHNALAVARAILKEQP